MYLGTVLRFNGSHKECGARFSALVTAVAAPGVGFAAANFKKLFRAGGSR